MKSSNQDLIEKYLCNELDARELADFQARMAADAAFRQEVEAFEKAVRAVRTSGNRALKSKLAVKGQRLDAQKKRHQRLLFGATALLSLVAALFWWWQGGANQPPAAPLPQPAPQQVPAQPETPTAGSPGSPGSDPSPGTYPTEKQPAQPPVAPQPGGIEPLFAKYFQPYRDDSLEPSLRGDGEPTPEERFLQQYWAGSYTEAVAAFEALPQPSKDKGDLQFLLANCLLQNKETERALAVLERLGRTRFGAEAKWLLALAYLKNGSPDRAKTLLLEISEDPNTPRQSDAKLLVKALEANKR